MGKIPKASYQHENRYYYAYFQRPVRVRFSCRWASDVGRVWPLGSEGTSTTKGAFVDPIRPKPRAPVGQCMQGSRQLWASEAHRISSSARAWEIARVRFNRALDCLEVGGVLCSTRSLGIRSFPDAALIANSQTEDRVT
jgi:hypothetical protein